MSFLKLAGLWLLATALLVGCTSRQSTPSNKALGSEFIAAFREAHDHHDIEAVSKLFCWDRVTTDVRKVTEDFLKTGFDDKIVDIKLTTEHPIQRIDVYVRDGVTYRFNLPLVAELVVENPPLPKEAFSGTYYPLGVKDGSYCIAQMAPVEGSEAHPHLAAPSSAEQTTQVPQAGKTSEAAQPTVVPAKTVLVVRLAEDLGLKTRQAGGSFSGTVAQPVAVDGVILIPVGSFVQGIVAKKPNYSPHATLTSVTVNGTSHKISTEYMNFNEDVVFPAGSQITFELLFPLNLTK